VRIAWAFAGALLATALTIAAPSWAQRGRPPPQRQQSSPEPHQPTAEEEEELHNAYQRASEPEIAPPADPLAISPELKAQIGSDADSGPPSPDGTLEHKTWFPYEERKGDYRLRLLPPLWLEHTRGLPDASQSRYGVPKTEDTEGLYGLFYYRRRSLQMDMDVFFPPVWRVRDGDNHVTVVGPLVHREAPGETDNWLAPLFFDGTRKEGGGYFHMPLLLTSSHWSPAGALTLVGPFFYDRTATDVDMGVAPFWFHGDNGSLDGNRKTYTLIPELFYYHSTHEIDGSETSIFGPVISQTNPRRDVFDVAPFYFHITGKPETGGVPEEHTTLFPFYHYGRDPDSSLFIVPGYLRRVTHTADTMLSLVYSHATTRNGATSLTAIGPVVPLWWNYTDRDLGVHAWAAAPFFYTSDSPAGHDWLTPAIGHFESYGLSSTWWVAPSFTFNQNTHGWESDFHPLVYVGRSDDSSHTVVAPVFWDFASPKSRTTIGFPLYWRFADGQDDSVTQVAANTVYMQKRVAGGTDWQFHFAPLFSYGEDPGGYFWNVLFGIAGYSRHGTATETRVFWIPIAGGTPQQQTASGPAGPIQH
jgi:hypothetical protein